MWKASFGEKSNYGVSSKENKYFKLGSFLIRTFSNLFNNDSLFNHHSALYENSKASKSIFNSLFPQIQGHEGHPKHHAGHPKTSKMTKLR